MSLYNTHGKNEWLGQAFTSREHAWRSMAFTIPSIVMIGDRLDTANAAARALGIIPHGESASGPAGADGEGKDA